MAFLLRFIIMLVALVTIFTVLFHSIMLYEGRDFSWLTGLYWTLTVMTTLGFGDITFVSDLGRGFSIVVLLSGVLLLLIMLPFTFIQFFYAPWIEAQKKGQTPRSLPADTSGHIILVGGGTLAYNLMEELKNYGRRCVYLCHDNQTTLSLIDQGYEAILGEHDASSVYTNLRLPQAAMLVALDSDVRNTNIVFTAREVDQTVRIVASAQSDDAVDILNLAGCRQVFQFRKLLGEAVARRVFNAKARASVITRFNELVVAEAPLKHTPLPGKSLREAGLRNATGVNVVGLWERGKLVLPGPDTVFTESMVMVIAGHSRQIDAVNLFLDPSGTEARQEDGPVVILGGGRVGCAAARQLQAMRRSYRIVDKKSDIKVRQEHLVVGDAADLAVLDEAGIRTAPTVLITTHDDDTNIYLTLYCRRLRKDIQIISRATFDRNVGILHAAGADLVLSQASLVTNCIINLLEPGKVTMVNEGLTLFRCPVGKSLAGKKLMGCGIRSKTHCSVVALYDTGMELHINPDPQHVFGEGEEIMLIGNRQGEKAFYEIFGTA